MPLTFWPDMGPAVDKTVAFGGDSKNLSFGETGSSISVALPAGETMLILDLSNPLELTIAAGEAAPEPAAEPHLYFSGVVNWDGFDGDNSLTVGETYILTVDLGKQTYSYSLK